MYVIESNWVDCEELLILMFPFNGNRATAPLVLYRIALSVA